MNFLVDIRILNAIDQSTAVAYNSLDDGRDGHTRKGLNNINTT